ncbi:CLUMA_CG011024, isoform A [Clunio marinus]|uniref:CLUMA_CG011024, isoform A n=1 Tax=Clunio marinus TaxID=568069 RepID=A0A1J1IBN8_9DIPT|nr:CLUMA_CG011024, isoform A [Clunio marinus]
MQKRMKLCLGKLSAIVPRCKHEILESAMK